MFDIFISEFTEYFIHILELKNRQTLKLAIDLVNEMYEIADFKKIAGDYMSFLNKSES